MAFTGVRAWRTCPVGAGKGASAVRIVVAKCSAYSMHFEFARRANALRVTPRLLLLFLLFLVSAA